MTATCHLAAILSTPVTVIRERCLLRHRMTVLGREATSEPGTQALDSYPLAPAT
jgi:hypothetical protein